jgi:hypothetical protein
MRFRGLSVTLESMRIDRQLEEALAGGDSLHLAAVFGISELTAMHYAASGALPAGALEQPTEQPHPVNPSRRAGVSN